LHRKNCDALNGQVDFLVRCIFENVGLRSSAQPTALRYFAFNFLSLSIYHRNMDDFRYRTHQYTADTQSAISEKKKLILFLHKSSYSSLFFSKYTSQIIKILKLLFFSYTWLINNPNDRVLRSVGSAGYV